MPASDGSDDFVGVCNPMEGLRLGIVILEEAVDGGLEVGDGSEDTAFETALRQDGEETLEHMPSSHRRYAGWTIERIREDARKIGPATAALCEQILESRPHPEQGYRACLGIVRLAGSFGVARLQVAAERAIEIGARTYGSVKSILDARLDQRPAPKRPADTAPIRHPNIRGPRYYH